MLPEKDDDQGVSGAAADVDKAVLLHNHDGDTDGKAQNIEGRLLFAGAVLEVVGVLQGPVNEQRRADVDARTYVVRRIGAFDEACDPGGKSVSFDHSRAKIEAVGPDHIDDEAAEHGAQYGDQQVPEILPVMVPVKQPHGTYHQRKPGNIRVDGQRIERNQIVNGTMKNRIVAAWIVVQKKEPDAVDRKGNDHETQRVPIKLFFQL